MATIKDKDFATGKPIDISKPEEEVRQEYEKTLHYDFQYPKACMDIEVVIRWGSNNKGFADLVVYKTTDLAKRNQNSDILGIIETKNKNRSDGLNQLMSYMAASSCLWGIWTNGKEIEFLYKNPESGEINRNVIFGVPHHGREIDSIGTHTFGDSIPARNLKLTFRRLLNELYTNTNISRREKLGNEMVKLLFCKLQDEQTLIDVPHTIPEFRVGLKDHEIGFADVKHRIDNLFGKVKSDLVEEGVFDLHETVLLENKSIAYVVGELQEYSLAKTDEDAVGSAFEVFAESKFVGEKGEFFTPREVVKTAIQIIAPQPGEMIMDPACGSGGFLISALQHIWDIMQNESPWKDLPRRKLDESKLRIAESTVHGIDKEIDLVKITKAYMAIIGDGKSQIAQTNSLHPLEDFDGHAKDLIFDNGQYKQFDVILTNPPFGSKDTKVSKVESAYYDLGHKWKKTQNGDYKKTDQVRPTPAQELFIERCLQLLKDGGAFGDHTSRNLCPCSNKEVYCRIFETQM